MYNPILSSVPILIKPSSPPLAPTPADTSPRSSFPTNPDASSCLSPGKNRSPPAIPLCSRSVYTQHLLLRLDPHSSLLRSAPLHRRTGRKDADRGSGGRICDVLTSSRIRAGRLGLALFPAARIPPLLNSFFPTSRIFCSARRRSVSFPTGAAR